jgi:predicted AAA+ superfamily ATPase
LYRFRFSPKIESHMYERALGRELERQLRRGKSVLLLGPRQTGKTTLLQGLRSDLRLSLAGPSERQRYERDPGLLSGEARALAAGRRRGRRPLIAVDEVQRVPALMDVGQELIDAGVAQFVFTGSSARKLRRGRDINLLPGRVVALRLDPLLLEEHTPGRLEEVLLYGSLPAIRSLGRAADKETDLRSYSETYLEEEVRQEALVRQVGAFGRFLQMAALESGRITNYANVSRQVGVSALTVSSYYEILHDCLVAERVEPLTQSTSRKKLTRANRYLLFDLGVRRLAAGEGARPHPTRLGELFEQFVGLELIRFARLHAPGVRVRFWRDPDGPEVDFVLERDRSYVPVEAKLTNRPGHRDTRHLRVFMEEHRAKQALVVCTAPRPLALERGISAVPWQDLPDALRRVTASR